MADKQLDFNVANLKRLLKADRVRNGVDELVDAGLDHNAATLTAGTVTEVRPTRGHAVRRGQLLAELVLSAA
jgi:hypothetical protein